MKSTIEEFLRLQKTIREFCGTDPRIIKEREEFFSRPQLVINLKPSDFSDDEISEYDDSHYNSSLCAGKGDRIYEKLADMEKNWPDEGEIRNKKQGTRNKK